MRLKDEAKYKLFIKVQTHESAVLFPSPPLPPPVLSTSLQVKLYVVVDIMRVLTFV